MTQPVLTDLIFTVYFTSAGVPYDPTPAPSATLEYQDHSFLLPVPTLTKVRTGEYTYTALADANMTRGAYRLLATSTDTAWDGYPLPIEAIWEVGTNDVATIVAAVFAYAASAVTTTGSALKRLLDFAGSLTYTAPDNAGIAAIATGVATTLNRLGSFTGTGVNTAFGFLRSLMRSDLTAPSDIGGTFNPATDSNEAISEAVAASSGSSDVSSFSGSAAAIINAIKAMTDKFSLPGVIFAPFFGGDSSIKTIWRWRDYLTTNGQSIDYQILGLASTDIVTWTIVAGGQETTKTMIYVEADIPLARLELTRAETGALVRGDWDYEIFVANSLGDKAEKYFGTIRVRDVLKK